MRELVTTMTQRGQITVPAEVRRLLGLKPRDKVAFAIEDGTVRLVPVAFTFEAAYGSVEPREGSFDDQIRAAKQERAAGRARAVTSS
jgi:AbrB family looped-hinge helix DNA binding protein